ncbi:uncharacterized protein LOC125675524 [Ostrea edulis]|uniref:uncharacterized protein LOC125675524 n=1 Tax=Ostrea edulis TaxID=37623 RepID=UPI0024AF8CB3|nr:uncharacterized protein LOC125675524 [Ostrea edulis]
MAIITFLIGVLIHSVLTSAQSCDNIDDQVCQGFAAKTNVCTDPCLSKLCPRTCNLCPLKCYHCDGVSSPSLCTATQICPSKNYSCIVTESLGSDFAINYRQGCATAEVCTRLFGSGAPTLIGRSASNLNGECCDNDLCNSISPVGKRQVVDLPTTMRPRTTTPTFTTPTFTTPTFATFTTTPPKTQAPPMMTTSPQPILSSQCEDVDQASCQRLGTIKKDMCNDDCFVRACPRTCGKCAECYSCQHVSSPANCTKHLVCEPGEKCYVLKTLSYSGEEGYNLGCMLDNVCKKFNSQAGNVFGKRNDPVELSVDGDCCTGDLCNHVGLTHGSTVTTISPPTGVGCTYTAALHHCPTNFHLIDGKCMMIPSRQMSYKQAESYCRNHCSVLIENFSAKDTPAIAYFIQTTLRGQSNYVYIGAQDADHDGDYNWNQAGTVVAHSSSPVNGHYCLTYSAITKGVHPVSCTSFHYVLCQAQMK